MQKIKFNILIFILISLIITICAFIFSLQFILINQEVQINSVINKKEVKTKVLQEQDSELIEKVIKVLEIKNNR